MSGINFVDGNNVGSVKVESGQPFVFLLRRPVVFGRRDIIVGFGRALLEGARRVHRREGGRAAVLRRFFHARSHVGWDRDQLPGDDKLSNLFEIFPDIAKQTFRRWVFALHLPENFIRRFVRIDSLGSFGESFLLFVQLSQTDLENFLWRKIDKFGLD